MKILAGSIVVVQTSRQLFCESVLQNNLNRLGRAGSARLAKSAAQRFGSQSFPFTEIESSLGKRTALFVVANLKKYSRDGIVDALLRSPGHGGVSRTILSILKTSSVAVPVWYSRAHRARRRDGRSRQQQKEIAALNTSCLYQPRIFADDTEEK